MPQVHSASWEGKVKVVFCFFPLEGLIFTLGTSCVRKQGRLAADGPRTEPGAGMKP